MDHAQVEYAILRSGLSSCKVNHALQTTSPSSIKSNYGTCKESIWIALETIIGLLINNHQRQLTRLPGHHDDRGLRPLVKSHQVAYLPTGLKTHHSLKPSRKDVIASSKRNSQ